MNSLDSAARARQMRDGHAIVPQTLTRQAGLGLVLAASAFSIACSNPASSSKRVTLMLAVQRCWIDTPACCKLDSSSEQRHSSASSTLHAYFLSNYHHASAMARVPLMSIGTCFGPEIAGTAVTRPRRHTAQSCFSILTKYYLSLPMAIARMQSRTVQVIEAFLICNFGV
ncbi:MAG: hypothetical protein V4508_03440 [Pseudomonadota bacterium]